MLDPHRFAIPEHRQLSADVLAWADHIPGLSDSYDSGDIFGSLMSCGFALCDYAIDNGIPVPGVLRFSQSPSGSDTEDDDYQTIQGTNPAPETVSTMLDALHVLTERVEAAGLSY